MEPTGSAARLAPAPALDPRRWWALALLCGAFLMVILDAAIVIVALPSIEADLGISEQGLRWVISAYALTFAGLLLLGGRAVDLLGRRRMFVAGVFFFTLASLLCGLAWSPAALVAARAVQGVGAAIMTPTALSIISTTFPGSASVKIINANWIADADGEDGRLELMIVTSDDRRHVLLPARRR